MKILICCFLCLVVASCIANSTTVIEDITLNKPETFEQLIDDYFAIVISLNPEAGSNLGLDPGGRYPFDQSKLTDRSEQAYKQELKIIKQYRSWLDEFTDLTAKQEIEAATFRVYLDHIINKDPFHKDDYAINCNFGLHLTLQTLMTEHHKINNKQDALDYIARLNDFEYAYDNLFKLLEYQTKNNIIPPKNIIERTEDELNDMITEEVTDNFFYTDLLEKISELSFSANDQKELLDQVETAVKKTILPCQIEYADRISRIRDRSDDIPGLWKIPQGDKLYELYLKKHTTTDLSPEEVHQLGLQEVARIQDEILLRFDELGFTGGNTFGENEKEYWNSLRNNKHIFPYGETGKDLALKHYLQILEETKPRLKDYFFKLPKADVTVKRVPAHKEKFSGAHYKRPALDGSTQAAFFANLSWTPMKPDMATLLFHETIPGHHLQIAYAMEYCDSPIYRNFTHFTAYIEGWALYAERLAFESGWHENIYSEIGYLESELHRAVRLVVDTGLHYKKWSRTKTYNYMVDNMGWGSYGEIDRYTLWAGQACAYKIGELKILELRQKAKDKLGNDFDLKEFHEIILQNGAVPLDLLEQVVNDWLLDKAEFG